MTVILLTLSIFAIAMVGMAAGLLVSGRLLRGSCGGEQVLGPDGNPLSCGSCPKKEQQVCPSDDPLVALAQIGNPSPRHHH